jgi:hypothetical protein
LSVTPREELVLKVYENKVLRRIFGPKREAEEVCIISRFITCTLHEILFGC